MEHRFCGTFSLLQYVSLSNSMTSNCELVCLAKLTFRPFSTAIDIFSTYSVPYSPLDTSITTTRVVLTTSSLAGSLLTKICWIVMFRAS